MPPSFATSLLLLLFAALLPLPCRGAPPSVVWTDGERPVPIRIDIPFNRSARAPRGRGASALSRFRFYSQRVW